jgi:hypothetical protein
MPPLTGVAMINSVLYLYPVGADLTVLALCVYAGRPTDCVWYSFPATRKLPDVGNISF